MRSYQKSDDADTVAYARIPPPHGGEGGRCPASALRRPYDAGCRQALWPQPEARLRGVRLVLVLAGSSAAASSVSGAALPLALRALVAAVFSAFAALPFSALVASRAIAASRVNSSGSLPLGREASSLP